jgi:hypothetical protein
MAIAARAHVPPIIGAVLATKRGPRGSRRPKLSEDGDLRSNTARSIRLRRLPSTTRSRRAARAPSPVGDPRGLAAYRRSRPFIRRGLSPRKDPSSRPFSLLVSLSPLARFVTRAALNLSSAPRLAARTVNATRGLVLRLRALPLHASKGIGGWLAGGALCVFLALRLFSRLGSFFRSSHALT